jgi:hypothetical protein
MDGTEGREGELRVSAVTVSRPLQRHLSKQMAR